MTMVNISVRVDKSLKEEMDKKREVNWSEIIRKAIRMHLKERVDRNLAKAVLMNEQLRKKAPEGYDSANVIREWRERRNKRG